MYFGSSVFFKTLKLYFKRLIDIFTKF